MNGQKRTGRVLPIAEEQSTSGSVTVNLLIVIAFVAVLIGAAFAYINRWFPTAAEEVRIDQVHAQLDSTLSKLMATLASDPTPESDSITDPVWIWIASQSGTQISLKDVSSRIDPNWVRPDLLDKTTLHLLFTPSGQVTGAPSAYLRQYRFDHGFYSDLSAGYGMLFSSLTIAQYLTPWSYANINVTDEFALQKLYAVRTGDEAAAEVFHTEIQQLLRERRIVKEGDLQSFLGNDYDKLYPVVNALSLWNVQFLPELILRQTLAYPPFKVKDPQSKADTILSLRAETEITPDRLRQIIGLPDGHPIYQYLGTTTWFWKATIGYKDVTLVAVLCRLPPDFPDSATSRNGTATFRVVSRRYSQ